MHMCCWTRAYFVLSLLSFEWCVFTIIQQSFALLVLCRHKLGFVVLSHMKLWLGILGFCIGLAYLFSQNHRGSHHTWACSCF